MSSSSCAQVPARRSRNDGGAGDGARTRTLSRDYRSPSARVNCQPPISNFQPSQEQREAAGFAALPIDEESALHVARLPILHRDPIDRILVSQAIVHGLTILTPDPLVTQYPARTSW